MCSPVSWSDRQEMMNKAEADRYSMFVRLCSVRPSDFEFLKVIGKGSFGKVLLARHRTEQQVFAVKVLQKVAIMKRNEAKHIMSERNVLLKNVQHPFLVGLHYSFQTADKLYFVLDYVNGGEVSACPVLVVVIVAVFVVMMFVSSSSLW